MHSISPAPEPHPIPDILPTAGGDGLADLNGLGLGLARQGPAPGDDPDRVTAERYRRVLGRFATGVALVATLNDGRPWAMTANAVASISLDPPIVMASLALGSTTNAAIRRHGGFAVSILAADQEWLARRFASRQRPPDPFADVPTIAGPTGSPIVAGCLGWVDCHVGDQTDQGDHTVFFGRVVALGIGRDEPLLYFDGRYGLVSPVPRRPDEPAEWRVRFDPRRGEDR